MAEDKYQAEMLDVVGGYLSAAMADEGIRARAGERMKRALLHSFLDGELPPIPPESASPQEMMERAIIDGYVALISQVFTVRECEHYFRRYPFSGLPISKGDHLRNCCELYFDRIVQFKDRLKALLNSCKKLYPNLDWKISAYLKAFEKAFGSIIRARNHTHHHGRYDDDDISQLALMSLLQKAPSKELAGLTGAHFENVVYRRAAQKWRKHVTDGADVLSTFCESVAQMLLAQCDFLGKYRRSKDSGSSSPGTDDH